MWATLCVVSLVTLVEVKPILNSKKPCDTFTATNVKQSFDIFPGGQPIPEEYECQWTIGGQSDKNIEISLTKATGTNDEQCVEVASTSLRKGTLLCATDDPSKIISTAKPVTVSFTMRVLNMQSFKVYYHTTNEAPNLCGPSTHVADDNEESFEVYIGPNNIPQNHKCNWTITGRYNKGITVYLKNEGETQPEQCIQAYNPSEVPSKSICVRDIKASFASKGNSVNVHFPGKAYQNEMLPFSVYYKLTSNQPYLCGSNVYKAIYSEEGIDMPTYEGHIPSDLKCTWTIQGVTNRKLLVYLKPNENSKSNQCVKVSSKTLCAKDGEVFFESTSQPLNVTYPAKDSNEQVDGFTVFFRLGNTIDNKCGNTQYTATSTEQSFGVSTTEGKIPADHKCTWFISGPAGKSIIVYLQSEEGADKCVRAQSTIPEEGTILCAQPTFNDFKSKNQPITVQYPGKIEMQNVDNFKVYYKLAATSQKPWSLFTMGLLLSILHFVS